MDRAPRAPSPNPRERMKIALISPYPDITAFGLRSISAYLRENGHQTRLLFLPDPLGDELLGGVERYRPEVLDQVRALCADCDLIGVSLMTNYFDNAEQITRRLKQDLAAPVVWGGVHPTIRPEECAGIADYACVGDGEEAFLELADALENGRDATAIPNIWTRRGEVLHRNPPRPLTADLDAFPAPDYSHEDHHILHEGRVVPLTPAITEAFLSRGTVSRLIGAMGYQTMTGRGCPHKCAYCINDAIKRLYGAKGYLRWRGTDHVMRELEQVRKTLPAIGFIWISDDAFFGRPLESIKEFCELYKARVGLPFTCLASPLTMSEEKLSALIDAGLVYLQMGVQSGSPRIQELFNRKAMGNEKMLAAMAVINRYKDRMFPPNYDFILDTPYETREDKRLSVRFIADIPKPFRLQPFSLVLYPGTKLHEMAAADGFIGDERRDVYTKSYVMRRPDYFNLLILLAKGGRFPSWLLKILASKPAAALFAGKTAEPAVRAVFEGLRLAKRTVKRLLGRT